MKRYTLSPLARQDLIDIYDYIAQHNLSAAQRFMKLLRNRFSELADNSLTGERRADLSDIVPNVRSVTVRPYVVFFQPTAHGVRIARILHGARDIRTTLGG